MRLNRKLFAALLAVLMMLGTLMPASAATLSATYGEASYYDIATTAYSRMLMFQDGVVPAANKDKQYGLIDATGREVVPFQYAGLWVLGDGMFQAENSQGEMGIINAKGEILYPLTADSIERRGDYLQIYDAGESYYYDLKLNAISADQYWASEGDVDLSKYDYAWAVDGGYYSVGTSAGQGLVDSNGKEVFAPGQYDSISVCVDGSTTVFVVNKGEQSALLSASKQTLVDFGTYDSIMSRWNSNLLEIRKNDTMGVMDYSGKVLVPLGDYDEIGNVNQQGYISAVSDPYTPGSMTSVLYRDGEQVKTFQGKRIATEAYYRDLAFSEDGELNGMMDLNGKVIIPAKYAAINPGLGNDLVTVTYVSPDSWEAQLGLYKVDGTQLLADKYTEVTGLTDGKYKVCDGTHYGVYSSASTKMVIPMNYLDLRVETYDFIYVFDGSKYSVLDLDNNVVVPASSQPIELFDDAMNNTSAMYTLSNALYDTEALKEEYDGYTGSVMPFRIKTDNGYATVYADYNTGTNYAQVPYVASNINSDGQFVYIGSNGLYGFAQTTDAPWAGVKPVEDKPSAWAESLIQEAVAAGIVPDSFLSRYTENTTRAEFCALAVQVYETVTGKEVEGRVTFTDTDDVNVQKAAALEVVSGVGDGKFAPDGLLTREQAALMLTKLAIAVGKPLEAGEASFADNGSISQWAADAVGRIQNAGVMNGVGNNQFGPLNPYTREQSIVTALKLFQVTTE